MPEEFGHKLVALDLLGDFELLDRPPPLNDARAHGAAARPLAARRRRGDFAPRGRLLQLTRWGCKLVPKDVEPFSIEDPTSPK